ncbi:hypothetical protein HK102_001118 [Quaeritorhiza haematococci]|nr:hypothetical protein HK102_001118 [Quaeritorhiza haematococci]
MPEQIMLAAPVNRRNEALAVTAAGHADSDVVMVDVMDGHPLGVLVNVCRLETGLIAAQSKSADGSNVATRKKKGERGIMKEAKTRGKVPPQKIAVLKKMTLKTAAMALKVRCEIPGRRTPMLLPVILRLPCRRFERMRWVLLIQPAKIVLILVFSFKGKGVEVDDEQRMKELWGRVNRLFEARIAEVRSGDGLRTQGDERITVNFAQQLPVSNNPTTTERLRALTERIERWADWPISIPRYERIEGHQATGTVTATQTQVCTTSSQQTGTVARTRSQAQSGGDASGSGLGTGSGAGGNDSDGNEERRGRELPCPHLTLTDPRDDDDDDNDNEGDDDNGEDNGNDGNNENDEGDGDAGYAAVGVCGEVAEVCGTRDKGKRRVERVSSDSDDAFMQRIAKCIDRYERAKKVAKGETARSSRPGVGTSAFRNARRAKSTRGRNDGSSDGNEPVAARNRGGNAGRCGGNGDGNSDDSGSSDGRRYRRNDNDGARRRRGGGDGGSGDDSGGDDGRDGAGGARPQGQRRIVDRGEQRGNGDPGLGHIIERLLANNKRLLTSNEVLARQQLMQQNPPKPWGEKENVFEWLDYLLVLGQSVNFDVTMTAGQDRMIWAAIKLMSTNRDFPPEFLRFLKRLDLDAVTWSSFHKRMRKRESGEKSREKVYCEAYESGSWVDLRRPIVSVIEEGVTNKLEFNNGTAIADILADVVGKIGQHADVRGMKFLLAILQTAVKGATSLHSKLQAIWQSLNRTFASGSLTLRQLQKKGLKRNRTYIDGNEDSSDSDLDRRAGRKDAKRDAKKGGKRRKVVDLESSSDEDLRMGDYWTSSSDEEDVMPKERSPYTCLQSQQRSQRWRQKTEEGWTDSDMQETRTSSSHKGDKITLLAAGTMKKQDVMDSAVEQMKIIETAVVAEIVTVESRRGPRWGLMSAERCWVHATAEDEMINSSACRYATSVEDRMGQHTKINASYGVLWKVAVMIGVVMTDNAMMETVARIQRERVLKPPDKAGREKGVAEGAKTGEQEKDVVESNETKHTGDMGDWKHKLKELLHVLVTSQQATKTIDPKLRRGLEGEVKLAAFFEEILNATGGHVVCIQEVKWTKRFPISLLDLQEWDGFWSIPSESITKEKPAWSGVATFVPKGKAKLLNMSRPEEPNEGRVVTRVHDGFVLVNVYSVNGTSNDDRRVYKMHFHDALQSHCSSLRAEHANVVVIGDFNTAKEPIDVYLVPKYQNMSTFLPEEREWMKDFCREWDDTFRHHHGRRIAYTWWEPRAKYKNWGLRVDYAFTTPSLKHVTADIHTEVPGSDHCPISLIIETGKKADFARLPQKVMLSQRVQDGYLITADSNVLLKPGEKVYVGVTVGFPVPVGRYHQVHATVDFVDRGLEVLGTRAVNANGALRMLIANVGDEDLEI